MKGKEVSPSGHGIIVSAEERDKGVLYRSYVRA